MEPLLPAPSPVGRPPRWPMREIINAIFYVLRGGVPWRLLPDCFPPRQTVYGWFAAFRDARRLGDDEPPPRHARPRAGRPRGQPVGGGDRQPERQDHRGRRSARLRRRQEDQGPQAPRHGRHRRPRAGHAAASRPASRTATAPCRCCAPRGRSFPFVELAFADSGYAAERVASATSIAIEIVRKSPDQVGFAVQPRRWVVERFFAWINRNRRLAKDFEATIASAQAFLYAASVMLLTRAPRPFRVSSGSGSLQKKWTISNPGGRCACCLQSNKPEGGDGARGC